MMTEPSHMVDGHGLHADDPNPQRKFWYTADDLVYLGYKLDALEDLFGKTTPGPDGLVGWTVSAVWKVEEEVIAPAYELITSSFIDSAAAENAVFRVQSESSAN
ncbi:hypothetical protein DBV08_30740 [Rhodococcus sp. KBW08]|nr:hypothetical protein DBV08_30740 [Rhodococcus sp. KBW08]